MADDKDPKQDEREAQELYADVSRAIDEFDFNAYLQQIDDVYYLWTLWADFHLYVVQPEIAEYDSPIVIEPEKQEHVYPIVDHGYVLSTSRGEDLIKGIRSTGKLFNTVDKMIALLLDRIKSGTGDDEMEVQVSFDGHQLAKRKAFEAVITLEENVVVTNFEPGEWGEKRLQSIKRLSDLGYGVPKTIMRR